MGGAGGGGGTYVFMRYRIRRDITFLSFPPLSQPEVPGSK